MPWINIKHTEPPPDCELEISVNGVDYVAQYIKARHLFAIKNQAKEFNIKENTIYWWREDREDRDAGVSHT